MIPCFTDASCAFASPCVQARLLGARRLPCTFKMASADAPTPQMMDWPKTCSDDSSRVRASCMLSQRRGGMTAVVAPGRRARDLHRIWFVRGPQARAWSSGASLRRTCATPSPVTFFSSPRVPFPSLSRERAN